MSSLRGDRLAGHRIVPGRSRAVRLSKLRTALASIPPHLMADSSWEGISARAAALGIVPGQTYGPRGPQGALMGSSPFIGEIIPVGFNFAPPGWEMCNGQLLPISEESDYYPLFTLLGTTYGGDGMETFAVPNLQGRLPMRMGWGSGLSNREQGEAFGTETVTLTTSQMPEHVHGFGYATTTATEVSPTNGVPAAVDLSQPGRYAPASNVQLAAVGGAGGGQPMDNMPPFLVVTFCIATFGIFPQPQ